MYTTYDTLVSRLNRVSDAACWPTYYISKDFTKSRIRLSSASKVDELMPKIKRFLSRKQEQSVMPEKSTKIKRNWPKQKLIMMPVISRKSIDFGEQLSRRLLKVQRVVPNDQIVIRTQRKLTAYSNGRREIKQALTQRTKIKPSIMSTIEIQANVSDEEGFF
jgi:hypothetical protein